MVQGSSVSNATNGMRQARMASRGVFQNCKIPQGNKSPSIITAFPRVSRARPRITPAPAARSPLGRSANCSDRSTDQQNRNAYSGSDPRRLEYNNAVGQTAY